MIAHPHTTEVIESMILNTDLHLQSSANHKSMKKELLAQVVVNYVTPTTSNYTQWVLPCVASWELCMIHHLIGSLLECHIRIR